VTELREAARAVAEGIRTLRRLTLGPDDQLEGPADVRDVIGSLSLAMSRMPQLLEQLATFLEIEHVKGTVADDQGAGAGEYVRAVSDALHRAGLDAEAMAAGLDAAREACQRVQASDRGMRRDASRREGPREATTGEDIQDGKTVGRPARP
jgi:hypothetical protein